MKDILVKGDKIDNRFYLLQQIKANHFMKLNVQEEYYKIFY